MKGIVARILIVIVLTMAAFAASGCATKSQTGSHVHQPKKETGKKGHEQDSGSQSDEDMPAPPPPPTY